MNSSTSDASRLTTPVRSSSKVGRGDRHGGWRSHRRARERSRTQALGAPAFLVRLPANRRSACRSDARGGSCRVDSRTADEYRAPSRSRDGRAAPATADPGPQDSSTGGGTRFRASHDPSVRLSRCPRRTPDRITAPVSASWRAHVVSNPRRPRFAIRRSCTRTAADRWRPCRARRPGAGMQGPAATARVAQGPHRRRRHLRRHEARHRATRLNTVCEEPAAQHR